jgi:bifunctional N-acetylglucosamine-1-phosphate-uridyltransferase/glucosamine-1-phosphate-acetyltransferase GlmU-like protein
MLGPEDFFELKEFDHKGLFKGVGFVWEVLSRIGPYLKKEMTSNVTLPRKEGVTLSRTYILLRGKVIDRDFEIVEGDVTKGKFRVFRAGKELKGASVLYSGSILLNNAISLGEGTVVEPGALIKGPVIIGRNTEIRQGAYIRGDCIIGDRCVVGHTTEMKNAVMLHDAKAGHFAYIGDSILGNKVNLGAGTKCANLKITHSEVLVRIKRKTYRTGLRKFGAILGDGVETGCNSVTSPGVLLGKSSLVYPNKNVQAGYYPPRSIISRRANRR